MTHLAETCSLSMMEGILKQTIRLYDRHLDYFKDTNSHLKLKTLTFRRNAETSKFLT